MKKIPATKTFNARPKKKEKKINKMKLQIEL